MFYIPKDYLPSSEQEEHFLKGYYYGAATVNRWYSQHGYKIPRLERAKRGRTIHKTMANLLGRWFRERRGQEND